ncbi:MAG: Hsp33 family molecular chaperone HslO, partial [Bacillus sp. (in: firmicutes)]
IIDEDGQAEAHCHFCNEKYHFNKEELEQLKEDAR